MVQDFKDSRARQAMSMMIVRRRKRERKFRTGDCVLYSVDFSNLDDTQRLSKEQTYQDNTKFRAKSKHFIPSWRSSPSFMTFVATHATKTPKHPIRVSSSTCTSYLSFPILYKSKRVERPNSPARSNTSEHPHDQEPTSANESDATEDSDTVQHDTHVNGSALLLGLICGLVGGAADGNAVDTAGVQNDSRKGEVAKHPGEDDGGAETLVIVLVLLLWGNVALGSFPLGSEGAELGLVLGVEVCVVGGDCDVDFAAGFDVGGGQLFGFVVSFCAPCDVVGVAEGVHVEDVDICWRQKEVLQEASSHMPGIEEEDGGEEVEEPCRTHADDEGEEQLVGEQHGEGEATLVDLFHDGFDGDED